MVTTSSPQDSSKVQHAVNEFTLLVGAVVTPFLERYESQLEMRVWTEGLASAFSADFVDLAACCERIFDLEKNVLMPRR
jgi:hypothetical protein